MLIDDCIDPVKPALRVIALGISFATLALLPLSDRASAQTQGKKSAPAAVIATAGATTGKDKNEKMNQMIRLCEQGKILAAAGKLKEATTLFKRATEVMPENPRGWNNLARAYILLGDAPKGFECFRHALKLDPNDICASFFVGAQMQEAKDTARGLALWEKALHQLPQNDRDWFFRGRILLALSKGRPAENAFQHALELEPKSADYLYYLAYTHDCMHKTQEAQKEYQRVLQLDPRHVLAWHYLGVIEQKKQNHKGAEALFRKAVAIEPKYDTAWLNLGIVLARQGKEVEAEQAYMQAIKACHGDPFMLASCWNSLGELYADYFKNPKVKPEACFRKALTFDPKYGRAYRDLGILYSQNGDHTKGEMYFRRALELDPKDSISASNLGIELTERKDFGQAKIVLDKATQLDTKSPVPWNALAVLAMAKADVDESERCLNQALNINPKYFTAWNNLAQVLRLKGNRKSAENAARTAIKLRPDSAETWSHLGRILELGNDRVGAEAAYRKSMKLSATNSDTMSDLAKLVLSKGDKVEAEKLLRQAVKIDPQYGPAWQTLSNILVQKGAKTEARAALANAMKARVAPNDLYKLGYSLEALGDKQGARQAYTRGLEIQPEEADVILSMPDDDSKQAPGQPSKRSSRTK